MTKEQDKALMSYAKRCDRFSAALERIMEICQEERAPHQLQIFEIAEEALIEEEEGVSTSNAGEVEAMNKCGKEGK